MYKTILTGLLGLGLICGMAAGQPTPLNADTQAVTITEQMNSHQCIQLARRVLGAFGQGTPERVHQAQIFQAQALMKHACRLNPDDAEAWRLLIEAADLTGDRPALIDALKQYLRLQPRDDVAQLRLIDELVGQYQTVDQRLAAYERMVDSPQSTQFSVALRSRLAYRAALLHIEQGRMDDYRKRITQALDLDSTNKDAARHAYSLLVDKGASFPEIAAGLFTLYSADPADASTHAAIADLLLRCGHYEQALSWYQMAIRTQTGNFGPISLELGQNQLLCYWGANQINNALSLVNEMGESLKPATEVVHSEDPDKPVPLSTLDIKTATTAAELREATAGAGSVRPMDLNKNNPQTREIAVYDHLPLDLQMIRVAMLDRAGKAEDSAAQFDALLAQLKEQADRTPDNMDLQANLAWACLMLDHKVDDIATNAIQSIAKSQGDPASDQLKSLQGWLAMRRGDFAKATQLLKGLADSRSKLGLCLIDDPNVTADARADQLNEIAAERPSSIISLMAVDKTRQLKGQPTWPNDYNRAALPFQSVPHQFQELIDKPYKFVMVRTEMDPSRTYNYLKPIPITLELRNVSMMPLSLGSDGTIPARMMVVGNLRVIGQQPLPPPKPLIIDLNRRLRLEPNESVKITFRADSGDLGAMLEGAPAYMLRLNFALNYNPVTLPNGQFGTGVLGKKISLTGIVRKPLRLGMENFDENLTALTGPETFENLAITGMLMRLACVVEDNDDPQLKKTLAAIEDNFLNITEQRQAWLLSQFSPTQFARERLKTLMLGKVARSRSPLVRMFLINVAQFPDSPELSAGLRDEDPQIKAYAQRHQIILAYLVKLKQEMEQAQKNNDLLSSPVEK